MLISGITAIPFIWAAFPQACSWTKTAYLYCVCPLEFHFGSFISRCYCIICEKQASKFQGHFWESEVIFPAVVPCLICLPSFSPLILNRASEVTLSSLFFFYYPPAVGGNCLYGIHSLKQNNVAHSCNIFRPSQNKRHRKIMDRKSHKVASKLRNMSRKWTNTFLAERSGH